MLFQHLKSILITPALKSALYQKGSTCNADIFMIDLEDSIRMDEKEKARNMFLANMHHIHAERGYSFRMNSVTCADGLKDLIFLIINEIPIEYLLVPKVTAGSELKLIRSVFSSSGIKAPKLIALIESAEAVTQLDDIAKSSDALLFGSADYALDCGLPCHTMNQHHARQMVTLYSNKYKIPAFDTPTFEVHDLNQLSADCQQSKLSGFSGKLAISKSQVAIINQTYQYSQDEISWARSVLDVNRSNTSIAVVEKKMTGTPFCSLAKLIISSSGEINAKRTRKA